MPWKKQLVPLAVIDSEDHTFRISTEIESPELMRSIRKVGLMCPPLLMEKASGKFSIVCGFCRVAACRALGWTETEANILDPGTEKSECARLAITDNAFRRSLNLLETSGAYGMLSPFYENETELAEAGAALGLPGGVSVVAKIKRLCDLPEEIRQGLLSETIAMPAALELERLGRKDGLALAAVFNALKLSLNKQREIITLVTEIAKRERKDIPEILEAEELRDILTDKDGDRNQKARKMREHLRARRFPAITRAEKAFGAHVKDLELGPDARLIPPPHFEGTVYALHLDFRTMEELEAHQNTLGKLIRNPSVEKILER